MSTLTLAKRNDLVRASFIGCHVFLTEGIRALPDEKQYRIVEAVQTFSDFNEDNDPHGEHDFGSINLPGIDRVFWKIDYYDRNSDHMGSVDPADPTVTRYVLTIMLASEY